MERQSIGDGGELLRSPSEEAQWPALTRACATYHPLSGFRLPKGEHRHYQQQYADMYFARLAQLKPAVESLAADAWAEFEVAGETARKVARVLDVRQGELCWVIGTLYMEMPLKPNVLDDIGKEHWIAAPPPRLKYEEAEQHRAGTKMMLEDESGRLRLTGGYLDGCLLVTGAIIAVLGTENKDGEFEALDLRCADLPRQPQRWEREDGGAASNSVKSEQRAEGGKVAIVSGLGISSEAGDTLLLDMLTEYLLGESASPEDQMAATDICRLIIAGNSLANSAPIASREEVASRKTRKYGYDSSSYNPIPTDRLDAMLAALLPSMPITILPGDSDPTSTSLPQQPIHPALLPHSRAYIEPPSSHAPQNSWLDSQTNPTSFDLNGYRFLGTGGQPVNDIYKYLPSSISRAEMMEAMLRWRLVAPTAPDTLCCYPFQDGDQFVLTECPHVFFAGNQPKFETKTITGPRGEAVRLICVPKFMETGEVVLVDLETLQPELVKFEIIESG